MSHATTLRRPYQSTLAPFLASLLALSGCAGRGPAATEAGRADGAGGGGSSDVGGPAVNDAAGGGDARPVAPDAVAAAKKALLDRHGEKHRARIERGVDQVAALWRVVRRRPGRVLSRPVRRRAGRVDALFARFESQLEQIGGHMLELGRTLRWATEVESGPMLPVDRLLAGYDPGAHVIEDMFATKVAFAALLNFPLTKLEDRLRDGDSYTRRMWAEVRLTGRFDTRIPGDIVQRLHRRGGRRRSVHRRLQPVDAPRPRRGRQAPVPERQAPHHPLEPARRAQGQLRRPGGPRQAADDRRS